MLRRGDTLHRDLKYPRGIPIDDRLRIEPQAGQNFATQQSVRAQWESFKLALAQDEPIDFTITYSPNQVLAHLIPAVGV